MKENKASTCFCGDESGDESCYPDSRANVNSTYVCTEYIGCIAYKPDVEVLKTPIYCPTWSKKKSEDWCTGFHLS